MIQCSKCKKLTTIINVINYHYEWILYVLLQTFFWDSCASQNMTVEINKCESNNNENNWIFIHLKMINTLIAATKITLTNNFFHENTISVIIFPVRIFLLCLQMSCFWFHSHKNLFFFNFLLLHEFQWSGQTIANN